MEIRKLPCFLANLGLAKGKHDKAYFYFVEGSEFRLLCWGVPLCAKNIDYWPIK